MISLLLTLFISLFSICPSVDRLEDQYENNVIESNYVVEKKAFTNQQYLYLTSYDLTNPSNVLATLDQLSTMSQLPTSSGFVDGSTFVNNGGTLLFNSSSFASGVSFYSINDNTLLLNPTNYRFVSMQYVYNIVSANAWSFEIIITCTDNNFSNDWHFLCRKITDTFGGVSQSSFNTDVWVYSSNVLYRGFNIVVMFNQNITYDFWRMGADTYDEGYRNGYSVGFEDGRMDTQATYDEQVYEEGRQAGYAEGLQYATDTGSTASTIFNGIFDVGLLPVNVFLTIFNFEVFGINIAGIVSALLTLSVVIIIVRFLIGGKSDDK